jgi:hypothetical protein
MNNFAEIVVKSYVLSHPLGYYYKIKITYIYIYIYIICKAVSYMLKLWKIKFDNSFSKINKYSNKEV